MALPVSPPVVPDADEEDIVVPSLVGDFPVVLSDDTFASSVIYNRTTTSISGSTGSTASSTSELLIVRYAPDHSMLAIMSSPNDIVL